MGESCGRGCRGGGGKRCVGGGRNWKRVCGGWKKMIEAGNG